ncbi:TPA: DUF3800 domain-containing protein [Legionella pneumophila subsp. pneumophila]|uniref:DUF3800 domain-containing protein n=4 Tax=Gammaproteobacteria TaxID=1236 RepID=A0AAN5PYQ2_LEGPN|nr:hypothetical protein ULM_26330 [Legionella pneumophila]HAT9142979.1 DUF3800 domain-containing protein [Legionella pneumophila subsp. pneumophila]RYX41261.1 DUF3800 domain-containing protein [Legionella pneumophila]TIH05383.1 hypothetical protein DI137_00300 [Legionella pneumophila]CZG33309.1 Protein of uncharacterised function (DUF3800) [Legionella pneumophila]
MGRLKGRAICIATDAGLMQNDFVYNHQVKQAELIVEHIELLQHQSAKDGVQALASKLMTLSPQLYVQLLCHIELKLDVLHKAIPYYAQRIPMTLSHFKWLIDFKNAVKPDYEDLIQALTRVLLQTRSLHDPIPWVNEWNDRGLQNNILQDGGPTYLREVYKLPTSRDSNPLNLGKIFEKMEFIDSKKSVGIQIIDLISSGVRRCLKKEFHDNHTAAILLGNLMIQGKHNKSPIHFISFSDESEGVLDDLTSEYVKLMIKHCKPMISNTSI